MKQSVPKNSLSRVQTCLVVWSKVRTRTLPKKPSSLPRSRLIAFLAQLDCFCFCLPAQMVSPPTFQHPIRDHAEKVCTKYVGQGDPSGNPFPSPPNLGGIALGIL